MQRPVQNQARQHVTRVGACTRSCEDLLEDFSSKISKGPCDQGLYKIKKNRRSSHKDLRKVMHGHWQDFSSRSFHKEPVLILHDSQGDLSLGPPQDLLTRTTALREPWACIWHSAYGHLERNILRAAMSMGSLICWSLRNRNSY